ncbi:30S ribosomal protein S4e [Acidiplasma sp. MBA-1]|uniref:Small ribosomal subunit protein eS4 n=3 Tax=Acidiplasma TaxID=507753 RepID=A0A0N8VL50_9ARCH|nr:30S ribosomal protein S4e [Acidiplasma sp. MBA-1]KQB35540.1 30S ribosomal protein S4e [Acidiplasma cupricumulans]KQB36759.1 30S ribosomal protein S4e [Acidiplasma aeolicum]
MIMKTKIMMASNRLKIPRKTHFWSVTPSPGTHKKEDALPLLIALRDYLKLGDKEREITRILANGDVMVDNKVVKDRRFPVGFMDTISIKTINQDFLVLYDKKGKIIITKNPEENKGMKLLQVKTKTVIGKDKYQIGFHNGFSIITDKNDLNTYDVVLVKMPKVEIQEVMRLIPGNKAFIIGGSHVGEIGTIKSVEVNKSSGSNFVHFNEGFTTVKNYVFVIGNPKYTFKIPENEVMAYDE